MSQISLFHEYFMHPAPLKIKKNWYFHIFPSRPMGPGPTSPSDFFLKTTKYWASSLILPLNHTEICSQLIFQDLKWPHFPMILSQSFWSEQKWMAAMTPWYCTIITAEISRYLIFGARTWHFSKIMMSLQGDSPKNRGFLTIFAPISYWNVCSDTQIGTNDTCFVQNFI